MLKLVKSINKMFDLENIKANSFSFIQLLTLFIILLILAFNSFLFLYCKIKQVSFAKSLRSQDEQLLMSLV